MNKNVKKALIIGGVALDVGLTIFLFVVAIIMLATMPKTSAEMADAIAKNGPFIGFLQKNPTVYLLTNVIPLFLLLAGNIVGLVIYVKKAGKKPQVSVSDLDETTKAALKAELLKDLEKDK